MRRVRPKVVDVPTFPIGTHVRCHRCNVDGVICTEPEYFYAAMTDTRGYVQLHKPADGKRGSYCDTRKMEAL